MVVAPPTARPLVFRNGLSSDQLANPPASVRVANSTARRSYNNGWDYRHTWRYSAAVVNAAIVTVAMAAAIWATVKAKSTATSDGNCHSSGRQSRRGDLQSEGKQQIIFLCSGPIKYKQAKRRGKIAQFPLFVDVCNYL